MDHARKRTSTVIRCKSAQHNLPYIDLSEEQTSTSNAPKTPSTSSNSTQITKNGSMETQLDEHNNNAMLHSLKDYFSNNNKNFVDDISENNSINSNSKRKNQVDDTIHTEFPDLIKPKMKNQQVTYKKEQRFKDAKII
ncbi:17178_t:CDS:2 [Cetraspora pellucida]|uniref:17178_t:CDS:1 n=1 Tax=Cetraspora pellucida TaxID=1433469 RepID=A0A9N9EF63_9GLOM|nr:17178_t:CDS:2 [Cetraspora pellucida]